MGPMDEILDFLKDNAGQKFTPKQIRDELGLSYASNQRAIKGLRVRRLIHYDVGEDLSGQMPIEISYNETGNE